MRLSLFLLLCAATLSAGPLHEAARTCDPGRLRQLLDAVPPPDVNARDERGLTPLHTAIYARRRACVEILLLAGTDRTLTDTQGRTPFEAASAISDRRDRAQIMLLFWHAGSSGDSSSTAPPIASLDHWSLRGQPDILKLLLQMGADPNRPVAKGTTPLANAALKGDLRSVEALLERGARVDPVSDAGTQPIHDAALGDHAAVIRLLLKHGASADARTRDDRLTPLHVAAALARLKALEALLDSGADRKLTDAQGRTALAVAERAGLTQAAELIRKAAAR